jgi:hypothetical protein
MAGSVVLAGCTTAPTPVPSASAPPPAQVVPPRPLPPNGAPDAMVTPPIGPDAVRQTPNTGLAGDETIWHLRSAWNVAALSCRGDADKPIAEGYAAFLKAYARPLAAANRRLDAKYGRAARDARATELYNYFASPPVIADLCRVALAVSAEWLKARPKNLAAFAAAALPRFEAPYLAFFDAYDRYRADAAAWDARYGGARR